jgi:hypothetical protein
MIISQTPNEEQKRVTRLEVARRLYQALVAQDPDRLITLRDGGGRVVARQAAHRSIFFQSAQTTFADRLYVLSPSC